MNEQKTIKLIKLKLTEIMILPTIAKAQGGIRNPFIDYPNLPELI